MTEITMKMECKQCTDNFFKCIACTHKKGIIDGSSLDPKVEGIALLIDFSSKTFNTTLLKFTQKSMK